jgi:hypothetical protein
MRRQGAFRSVIRAFKSSISQKTEAVGLVSIAQRTQTVLRFETSKSYNPALCISEAAQSQSLALVRQAEKSS